MGRLTLNVLLSFAQFEREVTGERIRDKIAASKKKGMWMGGVAPLGYEVRERRLVVNQAEAATVRGIFQRYLELGSVRLLKDDLDRRGIYSKVRPWKRGTRGGGSFSRGALYQLLANPIYFGEIRHKQMRHPGQHEAIIDRELWQKVQQLLRERAVRHGTQPSYAGASPLAGKLFDETGEPLYACGAAKAKRRYRYYVSRKLVRGAASQVQDGWRLAAPEIERSVAMAASRVLKDQAAIAEVLHQAGASPAEIDAARRAAEARSKALEDAPQAAASAVANLIKRVELGKGGLKLSLSLVGLIPQEAKLANGAQMQITRWIPLQLKRRGVEMRLVFQGATNNVRSRDPALLKAVARGYRWFNQLASGASADTLEIAKRERVRDNYVRRLIPLALLAPPIVEAICAGRQPVTLTAEKLRRRTDIPFDWQEQLPLIAGE